MAVFTANYLKGLKPGEARYEERDAGCPGLVLRVNTNGRKVFEVVVSDGRARRRVRLGTFPDVSLATARRMAAEAKSAPELHMSGRRVSTLWEAYKAERAAAMRSWRDIEGAWKLAEPKIGHLRLEDLSMRHGADLITHVARVSSPHRARHVIRCLNPMLKFAVGRGMLPSNPWAGLSLPAAAETRERVLSAKEWAALWAWGLAAPYPWGPFVRFLMLSGQRLSEVAGMRWDEIDGDVWTVPTARHKGKRGHEVPLGNKNRAIQTPQNEGIERAGTAERLAAEYGVSRATVERAGKYAEQVETVEKGGTPELADILGSLTRHDEFVFSTQVGKPIAPGSKLLARIHRDTQTDGWRFHDLRRTGATLMSEAGVPRFTVARVLGHTDGSVTAVYDRNLYRAEKRAALAKLAATVETEGHGDNVVALRGQICRR